VTPIRRRWSTIILCAIGAGAESLCTGATASNPYTYIHHPVSTNIPAAQFAFDRGLTMVIAYEQDEGERAFREAARLDPSLAMAWWGIALAVGPNINYGPELKSTGIAAAAIARAKVLAEKHATAEERAYIEALSARYSAAEKPDFDKLAIAYREAMRGVVHAHQGRRCHGALCRELKTLPPNEAPPPATPESHDTLDLQHAEDNRWNAMNRGYTQLETAILKARLAEARGQLVQATDLLREAVKTQDSLPYGEPPAWFYPVRESLGALLLKRGEIADAETTFSEGLRLSPNDPRLLLGLSEAQRAAGHSADAQTNRKKFVALWQGPRDEPKLAAC
jgi:tetratricopeptide (TPR) repeat protein